MIISSHLKALIIVYKQYCTDNAIHEIELAAYLPYAYV